MSAWSPLSEWNALPAGEAEAALLACCASAAWARTLTAQRPFPSAAALLDAASQAWFALPEPDWLEAFAHHPRIGSPVKGATAFLTFSNTEQAATHGTLEPALEQALLAANARYEQRFGFLYLVFASNRTAPELFELLRRRLARTRPEELLEAATQQDLITLHRIRKWLTMTEVQTPETKDAEKPTSEKEGISTHVLDTSLGRPAANVPVILERADGLHWLTCASTVTDQEGRARHLLADVHAGRYRLIFATAAYFAAQHQPALYPEITITFNVSADHTAYHIPLLLSPYGYSTYRGS